MTKEKRTFHYLSRKDTLVKRFLTFFFFFCSAGINAQNLQTELGAISEDYELMGMSVWTSCAGNAEQYHFGLRDFTRGLPMNAQSQYRVASVSKTVTALGLMKLYDQGAFDLDDDISPYLGYTVENPQFAGTPITFRMLLSHTSSLQDGAGYSDFLSATYAGVPIPSIAEVLLPGGDYYTANMWRTEAPGTHFAYSNINYGLIGTLIEAISGQRFDVYMQQEILAPLGIVGSYNVSQLPDIDNLVVLYRNQGGWTPQVDNYQGVSPDPPVMDGSADDLVSDSDCFVIQATPGCEDPACEAAVCAEDAWCCSNEWDQICVAAALEVCAGSPSNCITANGTPGCDNSACEAAVCAQLPNCCNTAWDAACADLAQDICGPGPYAPGTNGAFFAPQGGLRASAEEIGAVLRFLQTSGGTVPGLIAAETLMEMTDLAWDYNGSNGDNYFGLFNRWGLGVHHANTTTSDHVCLPPWWGSFIGHPGEAYGLVSDAYYAELGDVSFVFMTNGIWGGYQSGLNSTYYAVEEAVFAALCEHFTGCVAVDVADGALPEISVFPNPASEHVWIATAALPAAAPLEFTLFSADGKRVRSERISANRHLVPRGDLPAGLYHYQLSRADKTVNTGRIVFE